MTLEKKHGIFQPFFGEMLQPLPIDFGAKHDRKALLQVSLEIAIGLLSQLVKVISTLNGPHLPKSDLYSTQY